MFLAEHPSQGCFGLQSHCAPCYFFNQASFYPSDFSFSGDVKKLGKIDGHNLWPTICCSTPSPRDEILHNVDPVWKVEAIRKGKYKLLKGSVFNGNFDGWFDKEGKRKANVPFTKMDIEEQNEVYAKLSNHSQVITILSTINKTKATFSNDPGQENGYCYKNNHGENSCHHQSESSSVSNSALTPKKLTTSSLEVDCGSKPENGTICEPLKASCLFDVENDPCEYNNLAKAMPEIAQKLEELLNQYRIEAVPIRNLPMDPAANPKYHGYAWVPWRSTP
ncbi:arylsulfatase B [Trichonephila clavipes]|nr:arylsulfatase B [Trichonephila clavipes]